jgi:hypothetical protein
MADKALGVTQRVVLILRGPTGGMLACLLTASLLGGVAAAHPGAWADPSGQSTQAAEVEDSSTAIQTATAGSTCGVILLGLASGDDLHALTEAIRSVRTNCEGEPQAPGLLVALGRLRANLQRQKTNASGENASGGSSEGAGGPRGGAHPGNGSGSNAGGGHSSDGHGHVGSGAGSNAGGGQAGSGSGSGNGGGQGSGGGSGSGNGGGQGSGGGSGSGANPGAGHEGSGSNDPTGGDSAGGSASGGRKTTPTHR